MRSRALYQFSLRTLFILTTVVAVALSVAATLLQRVAIEWREEQRVIKVIELAGGRYATDVYFDKRDIPYSSALYWPLKQLAGENYFHRVTIVNFDSPDHPGIGSQEFCELGLYRLTYLSALYLYGCQIDDDGVESISKFAKLRKLNLSHNRLTDIGLRYLERLKLLDQLYIQQTLVSPEAKERMRSSSKWEGVDVTF